MNTVLYAGLKAILLDRDGVINHDSEAFIKHPDEWIPIPGAIEAIATLSQPGLRIAVCSNQSGIARGLISGKSFAAVNRKMHDLVRAAGGELCIVRYCPHLPGSSCECRKPRSGMIQDICRYLGIAPTLALMVGDSIRDIQSGREAGCRTALVRTGHGEETIARYPDPHLAVYVDLSALARDVCSSLGKT
jgi:D-glycero-D-manno-heptose 1,7-bisphosphate phosphatase